jgi:hypothetical protein
VSHKLVRRGLAGGKEMGGASNGAPFEDQAGTVVVEETADKIGGGRVVGQRSVTCGPLAKGLEETGEISTPVRKGEMGVEKVHDVKIAFEA